MEQSVTDWFDKDCGFSRRKGFICTLSHFLLLRILYGMTLSGL